MHSQNERVQAGIQCFIRLFEKDQHTSIGRFCLVADSIPGPVSWATRSAAHCGAGSRRSLLSHQVLSDPPTANITLWISIAMGFREPIPTISHLFILRIIAIFMCSIITFITLLQLCCCTSFSFCSFFSCTVYVCMCIWHLYCGVLQPNCASGPFNLIVAGDQWC